MASIVRTTTNLPTRALGRNGPLVPAIGLGCMGLSVTYGRPGPDDARFKVLDRALELGETFWDTSDVYGDNEDLIGKWFKRTGRRDDIFIATKFGGYIDSEGPHIRNDPEYVHQACAKSLKRLGIDTIDLYYVHRLDKVTPIEKTIEAMVELKKQGKIRYLGLSEVTARTLRRAHAVHPISAVEMEVSPFDHEVETRGLLDTCRELGVAIVGYSPLGKGVMTGKITSKEGFDETDGRNAHPRFDDDALANNLKLVEKFKAVAERIGCTPAQVTLAYLLTQAEEYIPIPGTKKVQYLEENVGALHVKLSDEDVRELKKAVDEAEIKGERTRVIPGPAGNTYNFVDSPEL